MNVNIQDTDEKSSSGIRLKKGMGKRFATIVGGLAILFFSLSASPYGLKMTISESVEHSLFVTKSAKKYSLIRGQYVTVKQPDDPSSGKEFVKIVAGLPGDEVVIKGRDIYVAGEYKGRAKEFSLKGEPLEIMSGGIVPEGHIYLFAPHKDSFDSRYKVIGFVPFDYITATAKGIV